MKKLVLALGMIAVLPTMAVAEGDAEAGKAVFNKCLACHENKEGKNKVGPTLKGVVGRAAGAVEGFAYSDPMKNYGKTWDDATLAAYITDPKGAIPGNKMVFPGVKDAGEVENLIAFLKANP